MPAEESFLRSLLDHLPVSILRKNLAGRFIYANERFARTLGLAPDEVLGRKDDDFYSAALVKKFREEEARVVAVGKQIEQVETSRNADGQETRIQVIRSPVLGSDGATIGVQVMFWDITDRQLAHEAMARSFQETENLLASLSAALIGVDSKGTIVRWNQGAEAMFGVTQEKACGTSWFDAPFGWDWSRVRQATIDCLLQRRTVDLVDVSCRQGDAHTRTLHLILNPCRENSAAGSVEYTVLAVDITAFKLLETQLRQAQKLEAIGQLSAGIAHEINSPAQFIGDNLDFVIDAQARLEPALSVLSELPPGDLSDAEAGRLFRSLRGKLPDDFGQLLHEVPDSLRLAREGIGRVSSIVGAMKVFSHPDESQMVPTDLRQSVESTLLISRHEWKYVADTETRFDADLPPVPCFPGDINGVLLNLVVNAAHAIGGSERFRSGNKGLIRVSVARDGDWVEIRIKDNGVGIPEAIRSRIFEPFFTTKEVGRGTGQGLFICHRIITAKHQGTISFETEPGRGTTFIVRLPLRRGAARAAGRRQTTI
jgi:PAS domain S-box-containing protein